MQELLCLDKFSNENNGADKMIAKPWSQNQNIRRVVELSLRASLLPNIAK